MKKSEFIDRLQDVHEDLGYELYDLNFLLEAVEDKNFLTATEKLAIHTRTDMAAAIDAAFPGDFKLNHDLYQKALALRKAIGQCHEKLSELIVEQMELHVLAQPSER